MQTIGERFKYIREQNNITVAKMALRLHTYHASLLMIENGTKSPSFDLIKRLNHLYPQYSIKWILTGIEDYECTNSSMEKDTHHLVNEINDYLKRLKINAVNEEPQILGFDINMENTMMSVRIICDNHENRVMIFGEAPFNIPQNQIGDILSLLNHIHQHEYNTAHCFVNTENGHLMSQVILNVDSNNSMDYDVFRYGLCDVCYIIDNYYKDIMQTLVNIEQIKAPFGMLKKNKLFK